MKIYTKTGDKGQTRLVGGTLVSKGDPRLEAYGSVDELNSLLGLVVCEIDEVPACHSLKKNILRVQNELFNLGSLLACEDNKIRPTLPSLTEAHILALETEIDEMSHDLSPLKNFILPGGCRLAALFHLARTVCRRAERHTTPLFEKHPEIETGLRYLNRLSDYFFTAARYCNHHLGLQDQLWSK